jgi:hypothetical protein
MSFIESVDSTFLEQLRLHPKRVTRWTKDKVEAKHRKSSCDVASLGEDAQLFRVYLRQSLLLADNFSCGIEWRSPDGEWITLARYNGSSHPHTNKSDLQEMRNVCHVHRITIESIQNGWAHENFATQCDEYNDLEGAKVCLARDYHVQNLVESLMQLRLTL